MGQGDVGGGEWRQLYLNNNKKKKLVNKKMEEVRELFLQINSN